MKNTKTLALILLSTLTVNVANAETGAAHKRAASKKTAATKGTTNPQAKLGTSFKFDGSSLRGKYQSSLSTTATVENDKYLEDLLGGRTQFEDRTQREKDRN